MGGFDHHFPADHRLDVPPSRPHLDLNSKACAFNFAPDQRATQVTEESLDASDSEDVPLHADDSFTLKWLRKKVNEVASATGFEQLGQAYHSEAVQSHTLQPLTNVFEPINELKHIQPLPPVRDLSVYSESCFGMIAKSKFFEYSTLLVILANAVQIGWNADYGARIGLPDNLYQGPLGFIIAENFFACYFTLEIIIRFLAYRRKWRCLFDTWFMFDAILVVVLVVQTWIIPFSGSSGSLSQVSILRLLRLLRIVRMVKIMRAFPQLMTIIQGLAAATKAVMWTAALSLMLTYTWAILFTSQFHQGLLTDDEVRALDPDDPRAIASYFGSMGRSFFTLLVRGTLLDDITECTDAIRRAGNMWMLAAFLLYVVLNSFTMMNMLVGILVEVVSNTAEGQKTRLLEESVKESIKTIFLQMDQDNSGLISREEFLEMKHDRKVMKALQQLNIKEKQFDMFVDLLFHATDEGVEPQIDFQKLLDCIVRLRPGTAVSAFDFAAFNRKVCQSQEMLKERIERLDKLAAMLGGEVAIASVKAKSELVSPRIQPLRYSIVASDVQLDTTSSSELVAELRRRLGLSGSKDSNSSIWFIDEDPLKAAAAETPGTPRSAGEQAA